MAISGLVATILLIGLVVVFREQEDGPPQFQGYVEGELVLIGPEEGGRIERLFVREGDEIEDDLHLFELESSYQIAQMKEADGRLSEAKAQLENLQSEQMRVLEIEVLKAKEESAQAAFDLSKSELDRKARLFEQGISAKAQLDAAQTAYNRDKAALEEIRRQIEVAHMAAREEQIRAASAAVTAAEAALRQAKIRLEKRKVSAPSHGRIQEIYFRAGEVVTPNQPVVALLPPGNVKIRFFVPEPMLSVLQMGSEVTVICDGCTQELTGRIDFIAREAEYTPPVIYGPKERAKLVFRVEARPQGEARKLAPGQPVTIIPAESGEP